jgi:hypothetical protein
MRLATRCGRAGALVGVLLAIGACNQGDVSTTAVPSHTEPESPVETVAVPDTAPTDDFALLRSRPVRTPTIQRGAPCPDPVAGAVGLPEGMPFEGALGTGAVHVATVGIPRVFDFSADSAPQGGWLAKNALWLSEAGYDGPILVRGGAARGGSGVRFGEDPRPSRVLELPSGPWDETASIVFEGMNVDPPPGWRAQDALIRVRPNRLPGIACYFLQIDGDDFSETILFGGVT